MTRGEPSSIKIRLGTPEVALLKAGTTDMMTTANVLDVAEQFGSGGFWGMLRYALATYRLQKAGYIARYPGGWYILTPRGLGLRDALWPDGAVTAPRDQ